MVEPKRYRAFISYSQRDRAWGARLHRWLESYRVPLGVMVELEGGRKLGRFFRDDDEMAATADIAEQVRTSIDNSESLIVICSPRSAQSRWVEAEIQQFRRTGRGRKVFALIIDGVPNSGDPATECFAPSLRARITADDESGLPLEPLGIDVRTDGRDRSCARLAAGLLGIDFDELWQRDRRRRVLRAATAIGIAFAVLSAYGVMLAMQTRNLNSSKSLFLSQLAQLQSDATQSFMDEDKGQYDRAVRLGMLATQPGILHPQPDVARDELARALHAMPQSLRLNAWNDPVLDTTLSPGGTRLVMASPGGKLTVVDLVRRRVIASFDTKIPRIVRGVFHPLHNWIALDSDNGILHLFDLDAQKEILATPQMPVRIHAAEFSFDGRYLLVAGWNRYQVWELNKGGAAVDSYIASGKTNVRDMRWLPSKLQVAFRRDNTLVIRDPIAHQDLATFGDDGKPVRNFDVNRAGGRLYMHQSMSTQSDAEHDLVRVNLDNFATTYSSAIAPGYYSHFRVTDDESHIVVVRTRSISESNSEVVEALDLRYAQNNLTLPNTSQYSVLGVTPAPGQFAIIRYHNGTTRLWGPGTGPYRASSAHENAKVQAHDGADVLATYYVPLTQTLITHGADGSVVLWDLETYGNTAGTAPFRGVPYGMAFTNDGQRLLASTVDHVAIVSLKKDQQSQLWSGESRPILQIPAGRRITVKSAYFTPAEDSATIYLANGEIGRAVGSDGWKFSVVSQIAPIRLTLHDAKSGNVAIGTDNAVYIHPGDRAGQPVKLGDVAGNVAVLALSPDGGHLAAGMKDGTLTSWNLQTRKIEFTAKDTRAREVVAVAFTPDSRQLLYSKKRGEMRLLSVGSWGDADVTKVNQAYSYVESFAFSPDGRSVYLEAMPQDGNGITRNIGLLQLDDLAFNAFLWRGGDYDTWRFIGPDRILHTSTTSERVAGIFSPATKKLLATKYHDEYGGQAVFDPHDNKIAISGDNRILLWPLDWVNELRVDEIRSNVCSGAVSRQDLVITERDVNQVSMLQPLLGKNVCSIGSGRSAGMTSPDIRENAATPTSLLESFDALGSPRLLTSEALREYLAYYPFNSLLEMQGKQAQRAKLLAASGYAAGIGIGKDIPRAVSLYSELAQAGIAPARHNLSLLLDGTPENAQRSRELMAQAADQGFWMSNRALGLAALKAANPQEARLRFQKALDAGDGGAALLIAHMVDETQAVDATPSAEACEWAHKGAKLMNFGSMLMTVDCLKADQTKDSEVKELAAELLRLVSSQDKEPAARSEASRRLARMQLR